MDSNTMTSLLMIAIAIVSACGGYGLCENKWRKKETRKIISDRLERKKFALLKTQRNVGNRIYKALKNAVNNSGGGIEVQNILSEGSHTMHSVIFRNIINDGTAISTVDIEWVFGFDVPIPIGLSIRVLNGYTEKRYSTSEGDIVSVIREVQNFLATQ